LRRRIKIGEKTEESVGTGGVGVAKVREMPS